MMRKIVTALMACLLASAALAQTFPGKSMKLVVPYPPGAVTDILGRLLAQHMGRAGKVWASAADANRHAISAVTILRIMGSDSPSCAGADRPTGKSLASL